MRVRIHHRPRAPAGPTLTSEVSSDGMPLINSPPVATTVPNEVLVAFVSDNGANGGIQGVSGAGPTWHSAVSASGAGNGSAAIWWALAPAIITNQTIVALANNVSPVTVDFTVSASNLNGNFNYITSPPISTAQNNQVLIAFITAGDVFPTAKWQTDNVSGGGLHWARAAHNGSATKLVDVWYAVAYAPVTNVQVTALPDLNYSPQSITVTAWSGIDSESLPTSRSLVEAMARAFDVERLRVRDAAVHGDQGKDG